MDREAEAEYDRRSSGGDRTGGDTPEFDELGTDCDRKFEMKSGVAGILQRGFGGAVNTGLEVTWR